MNNEGREISGVHLWLVLMKAHRALHRRAEASIDGTNLCFTDFMILEILLHKGPLPVNAIATRIGLTSGSGTSAVDRLEERNLVMRRLELADRRTRVVHLTDRGRELIQKAFDRHAREMERTAGALSRAERVTLIELLRKLGKKGEENVELALENER
jgi:MarR family 2-MHQ and catechol resistance regulon transcriptional repressor